MGYCAVEGPTSWWDKKGESEQAQDVFLGGGCRRMDWISVVKEREANQVNVQVERAE